MSVPTRSAERAGRGFRHWLSIVTFLGAIVWIIAPWWALWVLYTTHVRSGVLTNTELHSIETGIFFVSAGIVLLVGVASIVVAVTSTASMGKKLTGSLLGLVFIGIGVGAAVAPWTFLAVEQFAPVHVLLLVLLFFAWAIPRPFRGPGYFSLLVGVPVLFILVGLTFVPMLGWQIGLSPIVAQVALSILIVGAIVFSTWMAVTLESRALRAVSPPPNMSATLSNQVGVAAYTPPTNILAVLSLVFGILGVSVVAIVLGHIGLSQTRRTGARGHGMALAGLVLGYAGLLVVVGILVFALTMLF